MKRGVDQELAKAKATLDNTKIEFAQLEPLVQKKARPQQELERIQERIHNAQADLKAAEDRQKLLEISLVNVTAPHGQVAILHVSAGQYVPAGAA